MYLVYILKSGNLSYIGMTNDFFKRWKQHNKILKGGAKYTSKKDYWSPVCIIDGFNTKCEAMQCEWRLKRVKTLKKRLIYLSNILKENNKWNKNSPLISKQNLNIYITNEYVQLFHHISTKELEWF